jgi:hypothetical protein
LTSNIGIDMHMNAYGKKRHHFWGKTTYPFVVLITGSGCRFLNYRYITAAHKRLATVVRVCWWVWMVVRFVCVIRVPVCARVSRVCPSSPRCVILPLQNCLRF